MVWSAARPEAGMENVAKAGLWMRSNDQGRPALPGRLTPAERDVRLARLRPPLSSGHVSGTDIGGEPVIREEILALFDEETQPAVLSREFLYVPDTSRGGDVGGRTRLGGAFLHDPTVAELLPSDFPELSRRRPGFASLRHALVRFSFMLERLPPRHVYRSATLTITLDDPHVVVRGQRPAWVTPDTESTDTVTTDFSAALNSLAQLSAKRTRVRGTAVHGGQLPVITAEKRDRGDFGWRYEAQEGVPLVPRIEYAHAVLELPRDATEITGYLGAHAEIEVPRWGVFTVLQAVPAAPSRPFRLWLGGAR